MSPEIPLVVELIPNELVIVPASLELITTDGVVSFDDYTAVLAQFSKLELVESLKVSAVDGPEMTLSVTVEGGVDLLQSALVRSGKFQNENLQDSLYAGKLRFNWVGK